MKSYPRIGSRVRIKQTGEVLTVRKLWKSGRVANSIALLSDNSHVYLHALEPATKEKNPPRTKIPFRQRGKIGRKVSQLVREGYPQKQAVRIAFEELRAGKLNPRSRAELAELTRARLESAHQTRRKVKRQVRGPFLSGQTRGAVARPRKARTRELTKRLARIKRGLPKPKGKLPNSPRNGKSGTYVVVDRNGRVVFSGLTYDQAEKIAHILNHKRSTKGKPYSVRPAKLKKFRRHRPRQNFAFPTAGQRVQKIRRVRSVHGVRGPAREGELVGVADGWLKVKWDNADRPHLVRRSEVKLIRGNPQDACVWCGGINKRGFKRCRLCGKSHKKAAKDLAAYIKLTGRMPEYPTHLRGVTKPNPRRIDELSETFQGKASGRTQTLHAANSAPANLARLGRLCYLRLQRSGAKIRLPAAVLTADARKRFWIAAPRQPFGNKAKAGELLDFGPIDQVCYQTAKQHIGSGRTYDYVHDFEAPFPHLCVDDEGWPVIRGGKYQIEAAGIIH